MAARLWRAIGSGVASGETGRFLGGVGMKRIFGRAAVWAAAALALVFVLAAAAATNDEHGKVGDESLELRASLAAFLGPRAAPATSVNPLAFAAATTTADTVPSIDGTPWKELGPY